MATSDRRWVPGGHLGTEQPRLISGTRRQRIAEALPRASRAFIADNNFIHRF